MLEIGRRKFLTALIAAPFVVRSGILMPVKQLIVPKPIPLVSSGAAILQYSDDGDTWTDGPVISLEDPMMKSTHGRHFHWRVRMISDGRTDILCSVAFVQRRNVMVIPSSVTGFAA